MNSQSTIIPYYDSQTKSSLPNKPQKKRGKINIVACDRCKRDKKKCDGNYLTQKACKYCCDHHEDCIFSETNYLRISRILNTAKHAAVGEYEPEKYLQEQLIKYENIIFALTNQLEKQNDQINKMELINKLYLSLLANPQISIEQTITLKKLCEMTNNPINTIDDENFDKIKNKLLIIVSNDSTEEDKRNCWEELEKFVNLYNNNFENQSVSNILGFSYPSGSTTPIPSPQFVEFNEFNEFNNEYDQQPFQSTHNTHNMHNTHNVITSKDRNSRKFEPYPSEGRRPSRKDTNLIIRNQNDDIPIITVYSPQNNPQTIPTFQNSNSQFINNIEENLLLNMTNMTSGFDQFSSSFSEENVTSLLDDWIKTFPN